MSQPAVSALAPLPFELVFDDGEPLESLWHSYQIDLLRAVTLQGMAELDRDDYVAGGNNFVYYSYEQAHDVREGRPYFRGPDYFFVDHVDAYRERKGWVSWEEGGRLPDVIVELLSPSTAKIDRTVKKDLYARVFRTREYFLYDPDTCRLEGFRLFRGSYRPIRPDRQGRFASQVLGLELGLWKGRFNRMQAVWVRLFDAEGRLIPTPAEAAQQLAEAEHQRAEAQHQRAEAEHQRAEAQHRRAEAESQRAEAESQRAEAERQRAEAAEAELVRLRALLSQQHGQSSRAAAPLPVLPRR